MKVTTITNGKQGNEWNVKKNVSFDCGVDETKISKCKLSITCVFIHT
jgi:hypothetical protein